MSNLYEDAIKVIETRGWTQHDLRDGNGKVCFLGAMHMACHGDENYCQYSNKCDAESDEDVWWLAEIESKTGTWSTASWNDQKERTVEDVILVLKELASDC